MTKNSLSSVVSTTLPVVSQNCNNFYMDKELWNGSPNPIVGTYGEIVGRHIWMIIYKAFYDLCTKPKNLFGSVEFTIQDLCKTFNLSKRFFCEIPTSKQKYFQDYKDFILNQSKDRNKHPDDNVFMENSYLDYLFYLMLNRNILKSHHKVVDGGTEYLVEGMSLLSDFKRFRKTKSDNGKGESDVISITLSNKLIANLASYFVVNNYSLSFLGKCLSGGFNTLLVYLQNMRDNLFYEHAKKNDGYENMCLVHQVNLMDLVDLLKYKIVYNESNLVPDNVRELKRMIDERLKKLNLLLTTENLNFFTFKFVKNTEQSRYKYLIEFSFLRSQNIYFKEINDSAFYRYWISKINVEAQKNIELFKNLNPDPANPEKYRNYEIIALLNCKKEQYPKVYQLSLNIFKVVYDKYLNIFNSNKTEDFYISQYERYVAELISYLKNVN